jgi:type VI secretion system protein ImpH
VAVNVIGLLGPEGPMPLHLTRWVMNRLSNRWFGGAAGGATSDTTFLDFANLLQHRMMALYWRAWADARPDIAVVHGTGGRVSAMARALAGLGLPKTETGDRRIDGPKLHHATSLVQEAQAPERLTTFLETVLGLPVRLEEFVGAWVDVPEHLQTRLGRAHAGLGTAAVAGARVFDRASRAEIRIGPLAWDQFIDFLDDPGRWGRLRHAVIFASGKDLHFSLRLVLGKGEARPARLGEARLGRTAWLSPDPAQEADDLCFSDIASRAGPAPERSAA